MHTVGALQEHPFWCSNVMNITLSHLTKYLVKSSTLATKYKVDNVLFYA